MKQASWLWALQLLLLPPHWALAALAGRGAARGTAAAGGTGREEVSACSCDCCEVELRREALEEGEPDALDGGNNELECTLAQADSSASPYHDKVTQCNSLCIRDHQDDVLGSIAGQEVDTRRFCLMDCEPAPSSSRDSGPQPGDLCRLSQPRQQAVAQMVAPRASVRFLARRARVEHRAGLAGTAGGRTLVPLTSQSVTAAAPAAAPWSSIGVTNQDAGSLAVMWAQDTEAKAGEALTSALDVQKVADKAGGALGAALAAASGAQQSAASAHEALKAVRALYVKTYKKALKIARVKVEKVLQEARAQADSEAEQLASSERARFTNEAIANGTKASAEAVNRWRQAQQRAALAAQEYAKRGDEFVAQSQSMQAQAVQLQQDANAYVASGDMPKAQAAMQQSRMSMNNALSLSAQAGVMYNETRTITQQLPQYGTQAAFAAYHAQAMYNPYLPPPTQPLVFAEEERHTRQLRLRH